MTTPRRLIVMRHAKAEPFASSDQVRRLTERGVADATDAGAHLAATHVVPDHAVVSSATRARETWDAVATGSGATATTVVDAALYTGSPDVVLEALRGVPGQARALIFVGHNPTAAYLAHLLDDGNGDPDAVTGLLQGFPAGALTVLDVDVAWADLAAETGRVVDFYVGRSS